MFDKIDDWKHNYEDHRNQKIHYLSRSKKIHSWEREGHPLATADYYKKQRSQDFGDRQYGREEYSKHDRNE